MTMSDDTADNLLSSSSLLQSSGSLSSIEISSHISGGIPGGAKSGSSSTINGKVFGSCANWPANTAEWLQVTHEEVSGLRREMVYRLTWTV